jgi:hypothetical protein
MTRRVRFACELCAACVPEDEVLYSPNPFTADPDDRIRGCPQCRAVETLVELCDEDGCNEQATCGFPTASGYRRTCGRHWQSCEAWRQRVGGQA